MIIPSIVDGTFLCDVYYCLYIIGTHILFIVHFILLSAYWRVLLKLSVTGSSIQSTMAPLSPEETIQKFKHLGLTEQKAKETLKNANVTKSLLAALKEVS